MKGENWTLIHGEAIESLKGMPEASVDAVICDPPYSSGGFSMSYKMQDPDIKYTKTGSAGRFPTFSGDARDQRSYLQWCAWWVEYCHRILKPSGYFLVFIDWRQLPVITDAVQMGGIIWRGVVAWDKGESARAPHKGYFRHQCEYIVWGTKGALKPCEHAGPFPGCMRHAVRQNDKYHLTGKPTPLMRQLAQIVPPGGLILDPFAGSGTTGVGALLEGRRFIGIERETAYVDIARKRLADAEHEAQSCLFGAALPMGAQA